jgi:uncharacterized protein (DUF488 family)
MPQLPIYLIGYGTRSLDAFVDALKAHDIAYLIDVRTRPYSRFKPEFSRQALDAALKAQGIRYVFMGDTLGGLPDDPTCYVDGKVVYELMREKAFFQTGVERLRRAWEQGLPVVLMCSEGKPENCHRSKLIAPALLAQGVDVIHIDETDALITQEQVMDRITGGQPSLFGDDFLDLKSRKRYAVSTDEHDENEDEEEGWDHDR